MAAISYPHRTQKAATEMPTSLTLPVRTEAIDARLLPDIIELYISTKLADGGITERTAHNYRNHLNPWSNFWTECPHIHNYQLSPAILRSALDWMRSDYRTRLERSPTPNGVAHCWTRLRQVFLWAFTSGCTGTVNLCDWAPIVSRVEPDVHFPDLAEMTKLFAQPAGETRLRDIAAMAYMLSTGARRFEVGQARTEYTHFVTPVTTLIVGADHSGWTHLYQVKGDATGSGSGRVVCFDGICGLLLKCYLRSVNRTAGVLFAMTDTGIGQMIERHAVAAGVGEVSPHGLRRMLSDYWDETHGMGGRHALKKQLGHNLDGGDVTERHYISRNPKRVAREIAKWHVSPLRELKWDWNTFPVHVP